MTKKWLLVVLVTGAALTFGVRLRCSQPVRFTSDMAARIHKGMTEAEVLAILGAPAGNYADPDVTFVVACPDWHGAVWAHPQGWLREDGMTEKAWISDEFGINVSFDTEGRVTGYGWEEMFVPHRR